MTLPIATTTDGTATVPFVPTDDGRWYPLRLRQGSPMQAFDILVRHGIYAYVAQCYRNTNRQGKPEQKLTNILRGTLFAYLSGQDFETVFRQKSDDPQSLYCQLSSVSYCYDPSRKTAGGKPVPLTIPDDDMRSFILATATHEERIDVLPAYWQPKGVMEEATVIRGKFKGVRGKMKVNPSGLKYMVVTLPHLVSIRLPHIHTRCIKYLSDDE